ncbi:MAG: ABC transporter ATP-binding protein [Eubacterium sp.]|nr:ABC transporter ATP-binding protein [Eubacterium sp.]
MAILSLKDVSVTYHSSDKEVHAINHITLDVEENESLGIVGESGSGKTTLIMAILRLLNEKSSTVTGEALLEGEDLISMSPERLSEIRWTKMAIVFQKAMNALSPVHKIGHFISDLYRVHEPEASKEEVRRRIEECLELVNLPKRVFDLYPHELSGGMLQRVSIAMSLILDPKLLVMDEATTALDVVTQNQILSEIMRLEEGRGITRIMITHDMSVVATTCKKVAVLYAGSLMEVGPVEEVLVDPVHPYTRGLVDSFPTFTVDTHEPLKSIAGSLPDLANLPAGCVFAARCPKATEICFREAPEMKQYGPRHTAACHMAEEGRA